MNLIIRSLVTTLLFCIAIPCLAEDFIQSDIEDVADHPHLKRFENSTLVAGDKRSYDEFTIALEKVEFDYAAQDFKDWAKLKVEGARHTTFYRMPKDVTTLEALKNYENDLKAKGFEILFSGSNQELDNGYGRFANQVYTSLKDHHLVQYVLPSAKDFRYLAMRKINDDGSEMLFSGFFAVVKSSWNSKYAHAGDVIARIDLIETKPMGDRMVTIKAEEIAQQVDTAGKVVLYGILFDFNQAKIKPASAATLAEVVRYLQNDTKTRLLVVGHTDNVGAFEFNRDLSQRRAQAVVAYLVSEGKIAKERLFPFGVSFAAPVASNETEDGKAKNRRVELVKF